MDVHKFIVVMLTLSSLTAEQMDWGDNPDLVEKINYIEDRKNVKLLVVFEGEDIDLECQVLSTSEPVSNIVWKIDATEEKTNEQPILSYAYGEVFIQSHLQMSNISRDRDGSTVSCNYAKGQYGGSVRAVLAVFMMQFCQAGGGDVRAVAKEAGRESPGETFVEDRIKDKIRKITNSVDDQITSENGEYSVTVPYNTVYPQLITDRLDTIPPCEGVIIVTTTTTGERLVQISKTDVESCPEIFQDGYQFYLSVVREQVLARDLDDCAIKCKQTAYCKSFSFSTTENADENCHLSELSVGKINIAKDMTEDANWSVYDGIAEDDRCLQTTEPTTAKQTDTKDCKCNGFIDNVGGGECRQHSFGEWWCYVDGENDCPDSKKDAFMSVFSRSSHACSKGPCECNNFDFKKPGKKDICMKDLWDNDRFCYVPLESRCKDKRASKFFPSVYWSLQACSDNDTEEEVSGEDTTEAPPVVEEGVTDHSSWNFTSSHADCADYCTNSERCHYMHSKYDAREGICHLSTKPFYIVTHIHYGNHTHMGDWIKK